MKTGLITLILSCALSCVVATASAAQDWTYDTVVAADGVPLVVAETGNPDGPAILFIHGFSQAIPAWKEQLSDPGLQEKFRMVAFDLRGHGASGKPWAADAYTSADWGGDVAAVIKAKALDKPVLAGWSFGGSVMMAYLRHHGMDDISGLLFAAGAMALVPFADMPQPDPADMPPEMAQVMRTMMQMNSPDIAKNLEGTSGFVDRLAAVPLSDETMHEALVFNMMMPAYVRDAMGENRTAYDDLAGKVTVPTVLIHGDADVLVPFSASEGNQKLLPGSLLVRYEGIGHAPFLEDPERFNQDLSDFVTKVSK